MREEPLEPLEAAVLQKLLDGDHPVLAALRDQAAKVTVKKRQRTGAGFFTEFAVSSASRQGVPGGKIRFGDVQARIDGLKYGAGFLLYVDDGVLSMLEGYSYEEPWPERVGEFALSYSDPSRSDAIAALDPE